jgi:hypothetical protein
MKIKKNHIKIITINYKSPTYNLILVSILTFTFFTKKSKKFVCVGLPKKPYKNQKIFFVLFIKIKIYYIKYNQKISKMLKMLNFYFL